MKAAERLKKSYKKTGTKPVDRDASMIKQYKKYLGSLKLGRVIDINEKTGIITVKGNTLPTKAFSNAVIDLLNPKLNKITQRKFYVEKGNAKVDIDLTDHAHPRAHPIVPHAHDWKNGERQRELRPLTEAEKEKIKDIWSDEE